MEKKFYVVCEDILPTSILKTAQAKEMLHRGEAATILEAADALGMARSTFYKYKDGVFPFFDSSEVHILNISLLLQNIPGVLSGVLNYIAEQKGNILTINQNIPIQGTARVALAVNVEEADVNPPQLMMGLSSLEGVSQADIIGKS